MLKSSDLFVDSLIFDHRMKSLIGKILQYTIATGLATRSVNAVNGPLADD